MTDKIRVSLLEEPRNARRNQKPKRPVKIWWVRPRHLAWIPIFGTAWLFIATYGTPHLRFAYTWVGYKENRITCDYVGYATQRIAGSDGCPLIKFLLPVEAK